MADVEIGVAAVAAQVPRVLRAAAGVRSSIVDGVGIGVRGQERKAARKTLLESELEGMIDRVGSPVDAVRAGQERKRAARVDRRRPGNRLVDVGKNVQVRSVTANVGRRQHRVESERLLDIEIPLL